MSARTEILEALRVEFQEVGINCRFHGCGALRGTGEFTGMIIAPGDIAESEQFASMTVAGDELIVNIYDHSQYVNCDKRKIILHDQSQLTQLVDELKRKYGTVA